MFSSIWTDIRREYQQGTMITRLIFVNVGIFLIINLIRIGIYILNKGYVPPFYDNFVHLFCIGKAWEHNVYHPWVWWSNMFLHQAFFHLLWNMLYLYWFGQIVGNLLGNHRILPLYLFGGFAGALLYFIAANYFGNIGNFALGASAAVMAIIVAGGFYAPDYLLRLMFLGEVKLKYIVAVLLLLDLFGMAGQSNSGGHFAHLGGAIMGYVFAWQLQRGNDFSKPINCMIDWVLNFRTNIQRVFAQKTTPRPKPEMAYRKKNNSGSMQDDNTTPQNSMTASEMEKQVRLNTILDKIKTSGYDSLSQDDKDFLFKYSA